MKKMSLWLVLAMIILIVVIIVGFVVFSCHTAVSAPTTNSAEANVAVAEKVSIAEKAVTKEGCFDVILEHDLFGMKVYHRVCRFTDTEKNVTCWVTGYSNSPGISCVPNSRN